MPTRPDDSSRPIAVGVNRVRRRLAAAHALEGLAIGLTSAVVLSAALRYTGVSSGGTALVLLAGAIGGVAVSLVLTRGRRTASSAAALIERTHPDFHNVVYTAVELTAFPGRARPAVRDRVFEDAERALARLEPRRAVPLARRSGAVVLSGVAAALVLFAGSSPHRSPRTSNATGAGALSSREAIVVATLRPPAHTRQAPASLRQPQRIAGIEGTVLDLEIDDASAPRVRFGATGLPVVSRGQAATASMTLRESGYLVIETTTGDRLIPVAVTPDRAPVVRIVQPGKDLLVPDAGRTITVESEASDDFGLEHLGLRYTKVSGSGERYEFEEGELPIRIARHDPRTWRSEGALALSRLGLQPGDSLVYRVVARDARPGEAGLASSETFFVEIAGAGQARLDGFEMPPDRDRYALSQQMIVLKIQRLRTRERGLTADGLKDQTAAIAAEQRAVRANFVFLTGGHVEDEEEEAERSHEIQEGRLENTARQEISRAIGFMTRTEQALAAVDTAAALHQARLAVEALQRAFGRNRYILRALPVRSRVDPSRRLTGSLEEASGRVRTPGGSPPDARAAAIRELHTAAIAFATRLDASRSRDEAGRLAERALAIDPASADWQAVSQAFSSLRDALASNAPSETRRRRFEQAASLLSARARATAVAAGPDTGPREALRGAWAEELKRP